MYLKRNSGFLSRTIWTHVTILTELKKDETMHATYLSNMLFNFTGIQMLNIFGYQKYPIIVNGSVGDAHSHGNPILSSFTFFVSIEVLCCRILFKCCWILVCNSGSFCALSTSNQLPFHMSPMTIWMIHTAPSVEIRVE